MSCNTGHYWYLHNPEYPEQGSVLEGFGMSGIITAFTFGFHVFKKLIVRDDIRIAVKIGNILANISPEELHGSGKLLRCDGCEGNQNLEGDGFTMVTFGQDFASMSGPTKNFYRLLMEGQIVHGGHPVLRWMAGNVVVDTDPAGNIKVTKAKSKEKIDGIVAAIMALDRCIRNQTEPQGSVYDERGLLVL